MNNIMKNFSMIAVAILTIGTASITTSCAKDAAELSMGQEGYMDSRKLPDKETLKKLAKKLGISPEAIVDVEYRSGVYWCEDTYWPNGNLKTHKWKCDPPIDAACCTVVHVKVSLKGGSKMSDTDYQANGLIGYRTDESGKLQSVILMFLKDNISDFRWIDHELMSLKEDFPLINSNLIDGFDNSRTAFVKKGDYLLQAVCDDFLCVEIPVDSLTFIADIPTE